MNSGLLGHARFEELCVLASVGQISVPEFQELSDHMRACALCRDSYADLLRLTQEQLPLVVGERTTISKAGSLFRRVAAKGYKARFVARARERGIDISAAPTARPASRPFAHAFSYKLAFVAGVITLVAMLGVMSRRWQNAETRNAVLATRVSTLEGQNAALQEQVKQLSGGKKSIELDLLKSRTESTGMATRMRDLEDLVNRDNLALESLQAQLDSSKTHVAETEQKLRDAQQSLLRLNQEIPKLRASHAEDAAAITAKESQIADLSRQAQEQAEVIDKQQRLLAVDEDIRNLMAARNLHITDVFDVDGKGKRRSAFGRVFYTEERSLVFYAFDLDGPRVANARHSFQAWGQLSDTTASAVNLGIFYVDDPSQKRWILKFDNPAVLRRMNAVFVTAEPRGGTTQPTGQKLMFAYLGHEPNHP